MVAQQNAFRLQHGEIRFRSEARLELISAKSTELKGILVPAKKQFAFKVRMNTFDGFNGPLQREHFNENYLDTDQYPDASFEGKIIEDIDFVADGTYTIRTKGFLTIHGVRQERIIKTDLVLRNKKLTFQSAFTVQLADHNIAIPKVVHEKLAAEIKVDVKGEMYGE